MSKKTEEVTREVCAIESAPFVCVPFLKFALLSEAEKQEIKRQNPNLSIRLATQEERRRIQAEEDPWA